MIFAQDLPWLRPASFALGVLAGVAVHHGIFIRGEWHVQAPNIFLAHVCAFVYIFLGTHILERATDSEWSSVAQLINWITFGYVPGLMLSMVIYRTFFHRLTKAGFPGPPLARVSKLWHVWACRSSRNHQVLYNLQQKYGDFVRTGPNEVAVFHPDVFMATDGPHSECGKSEWYDLLAPDLALNTTRDKTLHAGRRRQWNRGFTSEPLHYHVERVIPHVEELDRCIEADVEAHVVSEVKDVLYWFSFDAMGDFVMGKPFGMLKDKGWHFIVRRLQKASSVLGPLGPAPWLIQIGLNLAPSVSAIKAWRQTAAWCKKEVRERIADKSRQGNKDLVHWVMMEDAKDEMVYKNALTWVNGDSLQAIVAGSAPTANMMLGLFIELARNPSHVDKIYQELQTVDDLTDVKQLTKLTHLSACMTEILRVFPALVTGGQRKTSEKGIVVAGTYIPPHTTIVSPQWVIARREDCFVSPHDFIPERWTTSPELVLNRAATAPFGTGKYSCLGRHLAQDIVRLVLARVISKYTFSFAPGEKGVGLTEGLRDHFITNPGGLRLRFEYRKA